MRKKMTSAAVFLVLFVLMIALVRSVDVAAIGPAGSSIGMSHLNRAVHEGIGVHLLFYEITNFLGLGAIACGLVFAALGLKQLIERRSLKKVDAQILTLGGLLVATGAVYVLFEKIVVNCRPVLMDGEIVPEASFPSSHTVLAFVVFGAVAMLLPEYLKNKALASALQKVFAALLVFAVVGRLLSGVHWFTDIVGGVFLSAALLSAFSGVLERAKQAQNERNKG